MSVTKKKPIADLKASNAAIKAAKQKVLLIKIEPAIELLGGQSRFVEKFNDLAGFQAITEGELSKQLNGKQNLSRMGIVAYYLFLEVLIGSES